MPWKVCYPPPFFILPTGIFPAPLHPFFHAKSKPVIGTIHVIPFPTPPTTSTFHSRERRREGKKKAQIMANCACLVAIRFRNSCTPFFSCCRYASSSAFQLPPSDGCSVSWDLFWPHVNRTPNHHGFYFAVLLKASSSARLPSGQPCFRKS